MTNSELEQKGYTSPRDVLHLIYANLARIIVAFCVSGLVMTWQFNPPLLLEFKIDKVSKSTNPGRSIKSACLLVGCECLSSYCKSDYHSRMFDQFFDALILHESLLKFGEIENSIDLSPKTGSYTQLVKKGWLFSQKKFSYNKELGSDVGVFQAYIANETEIPVMKRYVEFTNELLIEKELNLLHTDLDCLNQSGIWNEQFVIQKLSGLLDNITSLEQKNISKGLIERYEAELEKLRRMTKTIDQIENSHSEFKVVRDDLAFAVWGEPVVSEPPLTFGFLFRFMIGGLFGVLLLLILIFSFGYSPLEKNR